MDVDYYPTLEEITIFLLKCAILFVWIAIVILFFVAMVIIGFQMVEYHHAQQAIAIAECTAYNANSTDELYCFV